MRNIWRNAGVYIALAAVTLLFCLWQPHFRQPSNLLNVLNQSVEIAVVAVGMTLVILTGGIDLSVGSLAALSAYIGAWAIDPSRHGHIAFVLAGLLICLGVGAFVGMVNGYAVTKLSLSPFIATLGMMSIVRGLCYIFSKEGNGIDDLPSLFTFTDHSLFASLTVGVLVMALLYIAVHFWLTRSAAGRSIYAIGGNETATRLSGVKVDRVKMLVYIACGALAALGGLVEAGTVGSAVPGAGMDLELKAIAAVVIGGASLSGGKGSLPGTFAGSLLTIVIANGLTLAGTDSNWQKVAIGAIIMGAVAFDEYQKRRALR